MHYPHRTEKKEGKRKSFFSCCAVFFLFVSAYSNLFCMALRRVGEGKNECNSIVKLSAV